MIIRTDVKCLLCGRVSWEVELEHGGPWEEAMVLWPPGERLPARPRCTHCGGSVYLDGDFRRVHLTETEWRARLRGAA